MKDGRSSPSIPLVNWRISAIEKTVVFLSSGIAQKITLTCNRMNSKKRPNALYFGRIYDQKLLDLVEFEVTSFSPMV